MDLAYPPSAEAFRAELAAWLADNLEERFVGLGVHLAAEDPWLDLAREWSARLYDAGWAAPAWPTHLGGRGAGPLEQLVYLEELDRVDARVSVNPIGIANIAPAILAFGTDEQQRRLLPPMARGDEIWCQGFSEPDAGSDLASLSTRARRTGDHYVVRGQKVWTTLGHVADWCELLVRTDPDAPRHRGISCLLVDMALPGIEVRPLITSTGEHEFNEVFFDDVRVPVDARLGPEHAGWTVALATLANERAGVADLHLGAHRKVAGLVTTARSLRRPDGTTAADDPSVRRRIARLHTRTEHLRALAHRAIAGAAHGRPPGPESSVAKLVWAELEQDIAATASWLAGPAGTEGAVGRDRVASRAMTIAGGTTQVNKNILAQRVLGLPRS